MISKRPEGVDYKPKFVVQMLAAALLIAFGLRMRFLQPAYVAYAVTMVWVVGVTNAFNIVDIMDGLSSSQAAVAGTRLPDDLAAVGGAVRQFRLGRPGRRGARLPALEPVEEAQDLHGRQRKPAHRLPARRHIAWARAIPRSTTPGVFAPLLILFVPAFDTLFVSLLRLNQGKSPFLGSRDHLRCAWRRWGFSREKVVLIAAAAAAFMGFCAFLVTQLPLRGAIVVYVLVAILVLWVGRRMALVEMR